MKKKFKNIKNSITDLEVNAIFKNNENRKEFILRCVDSLKWNVPVKTKGKNIGKWDLPQNKYNQFIINNWDYNGALPIVRQMALDLGKVETSSVLNKKSKGVMLELQKQAKRISDFTGIQFELNNTKPYHSVNYDKEVVRRFIYPAFDEYNNLQDLDNKRIVADFIFRFNKTVGHFNNSFAESFVFEQDESVFPTLGHTSGVDYFINGEPYDQKTSSSVGGKFKNEYGDNWKSVALESPELVAKSLYEYQGADRFGYQNRVLVVSGFDSNLSIEEQIKTTYTIEDTHACIVQVEGGNMEVGLAPWLPYAKDYTFQIKGIRVVTTFEPRPQLETNFRVLIGKQRGK